MPEIFNLFFTSDCEYTFFFTKEKDFYQKKRMRKICVYHFEHRGQDQRLRIESVYSYGIWVKV
jgi:hypothetical protein